MTDEILQDKLKELDELKQALTDCIDNVKNSTLTFEHPTIASEGATQDPMSIHFLPNNTFESQAFSSLINAELQLRNKQIRGRLSERRQILKHELTVEYHHQMIAEEVDACKRPEDALFLLMKCVPCVLHMENRIGLKMLQMVLIEGIAGVNKRVLFQEHPGGDVAKTKAMINAVQTTINQNVLGTVDNPAQWKFPYDEANKRLSRLSLTNVKTRKVVNKLELLIDLLVEDGSQKEKWKQCVPKYRQAMELLPQKKDLTDDEIYKCQGSIDKFFQDWISLHGLDGMTNYIHLLGAGHIARYRFLHRNLYRHSQQGWEAFNALLKSFFFRRTGRGGGRGVVRTKLRPIGLWLQQRNLWLCGLSKTELESFKTIARQNTQLEQDQLQLQAIEEEAEVADNLEFDCQSIMI